MMRGRLSSAGSAGALDVIRLSSRRHEPRAGHAGTRRLRVDAFQNGLGDAQGNLDRGQIHTRGGDELIEDFPGGFYLQLGKLLFDSAYLGNRFSKRR